MSVFSSRAPEPSADDLAQEHESLLDEFEARMRGLAERTTTRRAVVKARLQELEAEHTSLAALERRLTS